MVKKEDKILFLIYLILFLLFIYISNFNINIIIFGTIYLFLLSFILKNSKNTSLIYKLTFLYIPIGIFGIYTNLPLPFPFPSIFTYVVNYWIFYFIAFSLGYYLFENNFYISKKSLIFYIISIILYIILFFFELIYNSVTTDLDVSVGNIIILFLIFVSLYLYIFKIIYSSLFIIFAIFLFLVAYFNSNEILIVKTKIYEKISKIYKYKKYIFLLIFLIIILQIIIAINKLLLYNGLIIESSTGKYIIYEYESLIFLSIYEFIIYFLVYRNLRYNNYTSYFLLFTMVLIIFFGELYLSNVDFTSAALHTRYLIAMLFFFMGIHHKIYKNSKRVITKALGISIGILILLQNITGEFLESVLFGGPSSIHLVSIPNILIALGIIHGLVTPILILTFIYLHIKLKI
ncbi:putative membrane protein [Candidatus Nanobsidianus stetteri]|uniref:Putative membrane protein n=1 Tax=Nanobsidianus stetteri TaxID=1294122 RepID=R1G8Q8_NANST|nr:putative membrane protein [Candidatus Nanobsidianus stetteri]